jgi:hypothetical protein
MNILALEIQKRSTAFAPVGVSVDQPAAVSSIKSIIRTVLVALCCSFFATGPAHAQSDGPDAPAAPIRVLPSPVILPPGTYQGIWRDEDGLTGEWHAKLDIDDTSIKGRLKLYGVEDYSGDKIRGKTVENDDGTLGVEFKTRDGKWKSKGIFDGQLLMGTYNYEYPTRRGKKLIRGEWAAQRVPDS